MGMLEDNLDACMGRTKELMAFHNIDYETARKMVADENTSQFPQPIPKLTFDQLATANNSRCKRWHGPLGVKAWDLNKWAVALTGEVGEACNIIKKLNRADDEIPGNRTTGFPALDREKLKADLASEIGDIQSYLDLLAQAAGFSLEQITIEKFNKKSKELGFPEQL